ncbi:MAG: nucleotide exchange factor GrpE [Pirellula sp.]|nr:nucleotide exchange factor GrpE [Pirellula sp.]
MEGTSAKMSEEQNDNFDEAVAGSTMEAGDPAKDQIAQLQSDLNEARDRALRAQAELENVRKRLRKEMDDERRYALMPLVADLLPVVDNLGRAITAAEKNADVNSLLEGVKLVSQQLDTALGRHNAKRIEALGMPFDPNVHAAIMQQPSADQPPNTVVMVAQDGYQLHDRVVRPAQVIVSKEL